MESITRTPSINNQLKIEHFKINSSWGVFPTTSWKIKTTKTALDIRRFLYQQKFRMLDHFNIELIPLQINSEKIAVPQSRGFLQKITVVTNVISAAAWKDVVSALKSSSSTTVTRIVRFGFTYFSHKSTIFRVTNIPSSREQTLSTHLS
jgi:hypothetical protein